MRQTLFARVLAVNSRTAGTIDSALIRGAAAGLEQLQTTYAGDKQVVSRLEHVAAAAVPSSPSSASSAAAVVEKSF